MKPTSNQFINILNDEEAKELESLVAIIKHYQQEKQTASDSRKVQLESLIKTAQKRMESIGSLELE
jgi:hypothetical protein